MKIKRIFSYLFLCIILLLGLSFAALNAEYVGINYYLGKSMVPLSLLLVYTLGIGILLGLVTPLISLLKLKRENHALKSTVSKISASSSASPLSSS